MDKKIIDLNLTENCHCVDSEGDAYSYCDRCDGTGEVLTDNGRRHLRFLRKYIFKEIYE